MSPAFSIFFRWYYIEIYLLFNIVSVLFTGDAPKEVEKEILNKDIDVDVLKVGHHGSNTSSSEKFISKLNIKSAVISSSKKVLNNSTKVTIFVFLLIIGISSSKLISNDVFLNKINSSNAQTVSVLST